MNYQRIYDELIARGKERNWTKKTTPCYTENHHILPKSMGGGDEKENLVRLTAREHFLAHWMLYRIHRNQSMACAWIAMSMKYGETEKRYTSKSFEYAKIALAEQNSIYFSGEGNPMYGREHTEESKEKNRESQYKAIEDFKEICPHCGEETIFSWRDRLHFGNCRLNPNHKDKIWVKYGISPETFQHEILKMFEDGVTDAVLISEKIGCTLNLIGNTQTLYNKTNNVKIRLTGTSSFGKGRFKGIHPKYGTKLGSKKHDALLLLLKGERNLKRLKNKIKCSSATVDDARWTIEKIDNIKITMNKS